MLEIGLFQLQEIMFNHKYVGKFEGWHLTGAGLLFLMPETLTCKECATDTL